MSPSDINVDMSLHQARVTRHALHVAINDGHYVMRENYEAALQVKAMLDLRLAQADKDAAA